MKKMKNIVIVLIILFLGLSTTYSQTPCIPGGTPHILIRTGNALGMTGEIYGTQTFSTGAFTWAKGFQTPVRDQNWIIHSGNTSSLNGTPPYDPFLIPILGSGNWHDFTTSNWIGAKNSNLNELEVVVYRFDFYVNNVSSLSLPNLHLAVLADDLLEVYLNEDPGTTWPTPLTINSNNRIGKKPLTTSESPVYQINNHLIINENDHMLFHNGWNTLYFKVKNQQSYSGLNVTGSLTNHNLDFNIDDSRCTNQQINISYNVNSGSLTDVNGNSFEQCLNGYTIQLVQGTSYDNLTLVSTAQTISGNITNSYQGSFPITSSSLGSYSGNYYLQLLDPNGHIIGTRLVSINLPQTTCCPLFSTAITSDTRCRNGLLEILVNLDGVNSSTPVNLSQFVLRLSKAGQTSIDITIPNTGSNIFSIPISFQASDMNGFLVDLTLVDPTTGVVVCNLGATVNVPPSSCCPSITSQVLADNRCSGGGVNIEYTITDNSYFNDLSYLNGGDLTIWKGINSIVNQPLTGLSGPTITATFALNTTDLNALSFTTSISSEILLSCVGIITTPPAYCCPTITANIVSDERCDGGGVTVAYSVTFIDNMLGYQLLFSDGSVRNLKGNSVSSDLVINLDQDATLDLAISLIHPDGTNISTLNNCSFTLLIIEACCGCVSSFAPITGGKYVLSGWVREDRVVSAAPIFSYSQPSIEVSFIGINSPTVIGKPSGEIIDGWQRIEHVFDIPVNAVEIIVHLVAGDGVDVYFDDIRVHPFDASMASYVFDPKTLRMVAELDDRNYATFYEYDEEGALIRVKKETERGIMTIQEHRNNSYKGNKAF